MVRGQRFSVVGEEVPGTARPLGRYTRVREGGGPASDAGRPGKDP